MAEKHQLLKYVIYFIVFALNLMAFNFYMGIFRAKGNAEILVSIF